MWFTSDNAGPAAPEVMAGLARANEGPARAYGADAIMERVTAQVRALFEAPDAAVHLVATGTAANALALACLCPPWATIYVHREAHTACDECAAPEFFTGGAKLTLLDGPDGRIAPASLAAALAAAAPAGVHNVQPGALSLTNATEAGTIYRPADVAALARMAKARGLPVHMDGARFANAVARLGCSPAELTRAAGVDALSFGGTKNGLLGVEAVILFDPGRSWEFELRRKRGGHLVSKHRYLSAQMEAYLTGGLWLRLAAQANAMADRLAAGLRGAGAELLYPVEANMMFVRLSRAQHLRLAAHGASYYHWGPEPGAEGDPAEMSACRLVCGWQTTAAEVDRFVELAAG
jgi:threonine aldolase